MIALSGLPQKTVMQVPENSQNAEYEIAGFDVHGAGTVTLVRKNGHSPTAFGETSTSVLYDGSILDALCNTTIFSSYPAELREIILPVNIICGTDTNTSVTLQRRCFAPSYTEVTGNACNGAMENARLTGITSDKKNASGQSISWRTRSRWGIGSVWTVSSTGMGYGDPTQGVPYAVPAFVLPSSKLAIEPKNADGSYNLLYAKKIDADVSLGSFAARPFRIRTALNYTGVITSLYACNNFADADPTWEMITDGVEHEFTNTTKTADEWRVGLRVDIAKLGSGLAQLRQSPAVIRV